MKKSIAVILLGSALLLPNNTSVEASSPNNNVQVQKVQYIDCVGWGGMQFDFNKKNNYQGFKYDFKSILDKLAKDAGITISKPNDKPVNEPTTPEVDKTPEGKPVPESTPVPEAKPVPETKPVPEEKPAPEAKPVPEEKPVPEAKPVPEEKPAPVPTAPTPTPEKPAEPVEAAPNASVSAIEKEVLDLTNAERQKAGLAPLQTDSNLMNSARQKSTDMATNRYFSHTSPTYGSPFDQMKANGVSYSAAAENIAQGQRTAAEVVKAWMESPGHRQNILTPGFTHIGIGYDANGNYWTQQFITK